MIKIQFKHQKILLIIALFATLFSFSTFAEVANPNPNLIISITSGDSFEVAGPRQEISGHFAVRLIDPQGNPIPDLTVAFFTNKEGCFSTDPHCMLPPPEMYGHFTSSLENVLTDANGVARAGTYIGGTVPGRYEVVALVLDTASARNADVLKNDGTPRAFFKINQFASAPVTSLPASGVFTLLLLAIVIMLVSFRCTKRNSLN